MLIAFHKPYGIISQFTSDGSKHGTLASFNLPRDVYPLGRLDADSEGLLLLTNESALNRDLLLPEHRHPVRPAIVQRLVAWQRSQREDWPGIKKTNTRSHKLINKHSIVSSNTIP